MWIEKLRTLSTVRWNGVFLRLIIGTHRSTFYRKPKHRTLRPLLLLPKLLQLKIGFLSMQTRNRFGWIKPRFLRHLVFRIWEHLGMALHALRERQPDLFLIFEHKIDYALPLYVVLWLRGKPVFIFVHEMQQCATITRRSRLLLNLCLALVRFGPFYPIFIALDDAVLDDGSRFSRGKSLTIPHPHPMANLPAPSRLPRGSRSRLRVGMIETTRREKPARDLFAALVAAREQFDFEFVIGAPLGKEPMPDWLRASGAEIVDTTTEAQFNRYLQSLDIFVADYLESEYYFRPSGVIVDAGMNGCYVLCPDFPVFRAQIDLPVSIGATFSGLDHLPMRLGEAIGRLKSGSVDFDTWREHHCIEKIAEQFRYFLQKHGLTNRQ